MRLVKARRKRPEQIEILLVEDSVDEAYLIGECFSEAKMKHAPHHVADGASAIDFLHSRGDYQEASRPDLIILDLKLPKLSGRDLLRHIKQEPDLRRIPVVVLSGMRDEDLKRECLDLQASCCLTKPLFAGDYIKTVRQIRDFWLSTHGPDLVD